MDYMLSAHPSPNRNRRRASEGPRDPRSTATLRPFAWIVTWLALTSSALALELNPNQITLAAVPASPAVDAALVDLRRDFKDVLGVVPPTAENPSIHISVDPQLAAETFVIDITDRVEIRGGDELGAIYGLYEFSHRFLGVDPLWFWKDIPPAKKTSLTLAPQRIESGAPAFHYRGWFLNDEDLLGAWKPAPGERFRDWPDRAKFINQSISDERAAYDTRLLRYYRPIIGPESMDRVFEALLRLRGNLIIPASFIDIMNEPEAAVIRAAVHRGLYVSQHHVEPMGVSYFAYETWWAKKMGGNPTPSFSYRENPEAFRTVWSAYARRWREVAGDHIIWQLGLRGRGDRPLWDHDPKAKAVAGELIGSALRDQLEIIHAVDPRAAPPATLTLWAEGADLIAKRELTLPPGITCVFSDHSVTQTMQKDFLTMSREPGRGHGFYYHIAVWPLGPHLVQGPRPSAIAEVVNQVAAKHDTAYAILNVANLREHVMGASVWMGQVWKPGLVKDSEWLEHWSPSGLAPLHLELIDCVQLAPGVRLYDGAARQAIYRILFALETKADPGSVRVTATRDQLITAVSRLDQLSGRLNHERGRIAPELLNFYDTNLRAQALILRGLYASLAALLETPANPALAARELDAALSGYPVGEQGRWSDWYRGDTKMDLALLRDRLVALRSNVR